MVRSNCTKLQLSVKEEEEMAEEEIAEEEMGAEEVGAEEVGSEEEEKDMEEEEKELEEKEDGGDDVKKEWKDGNKRVGAKSQ